MNRACETTLKPNLKIMGNKNTENIIIKNHSIKFPNYREEVAIRCRGHVAHQLRSEKKFLHQM